MIKVFNSDHALQTSSTYLIPLNINSNCVHCSVCTISDYSDHEIIVIV